MQTKFVFVLKLCAALLFAAFVLNFRPAHAAPAATFTVNVTDDADDGNCDATHCSLREAINAANALLGVTHNIHFNIAKGAGKCDIVGNRCRITLTNALPVITKPMVIDGYTQPDTKANTLAVGSDAVLRIILRDSAYHSKFGFKVTGGGTTIRGLVMENFHTAIWILSNNNVVEGNFLGVDSTGSADASNHAGVSLEGAQGNRIGGTTPAARNIISGNTGYGIYVNTSTGNRILGNYIGTDDNGVNALGNFVGIQLSDSQNNQIGKAKGGQNVIAANEYGMRIMGDADRNRIQSNLIGVAADGTALGNLDYAMALMEFSALQPDGNRIRKNQIRHNAGGGILTVAGVNNTISRNAISDNDGMGIDLNSDGLTLNDAKDADSGANNLQNFPTLDSVLSVNGQTKITGKLNSAKNKTYRIEIFTNTACDNINGFSYGEGEKYFGSAVMTTNAKGKGIFTVTVSKGLALPTELSATATELVNGKLASTSEFSRCLVAGF